ncbi:spore coat protein GerQ [Bacillus sp. 2205SS5-2]|uniref:spore coat protein GerQ n=1 Tax=Bacillus sp. 2205SS5-2 TaxID=3109031 RepID=UPI0030058D4B
MNQGQYYGYNPQAYYPGYNQPQYGGNQGGMQVPPPTNAPSPSQNLPGQLPVEESYIENILRLNKGKVATIYMTFENNKEWNAKVFKGIIETAGRDHIIISDPQTGKRYLLPMIYLDYITFDEEIDYFPGTAPVAYSPR